MLYPDLLNPTFLQVLTINPKMEFIGTLRKSRFWQVKVLIESFDVPAAPTTIEPVLLYQRTCRNLIKKPWVLIRVPYRNPNIQGVMTGFLNQVPTLRTKEPPELEVTAKKTQLEISGPSALNRSLGKLFRSVESGALKNTIVLIQASTLLLCYLDASGHAAVSSRGNKKAPRLITVQI